MRERKTRVGRPSPANRKHYLFVPRYPSGWLAPFPVDAVWTPDCGAGTTCRQGCLSELAAKRDLEYLKARVGEAPQVIPSGGTFAEAAAELLAYQSGRVDPNTHRGMASHLKLAGERFGSWKLHAITRAELEKYQVELHGEGLAVSTINARIRSILDVIRRAQPGMVPHVAKFSPVAAEPTDFSAETETGRYVTAAELAPLFAALDRDIPALAALAELRSLCGVRTHALAAIRWAHVQADRITIPARLMKNRTLPYVLPLTPDVARIIASLDRGEPGAFVFRDLAGKSLLGSARRGGLSTPAQRTWNAAVAKVGLGGFEFADLRHVAAARIQKAGRNDLSRKILMAWSTGIDGRYTDSFSDASDTLIAVCALVARELAETRTDNILPYRARA